MLYIAIAKYKTIPTQGYLQQSYSTYCFGFSPEEAYDLAAKSTASMANVEIFVHGVESTIFKREVNFTKVTFNADR